MLACPSCGSIEIDCETPRTVYACLSSDYDQRPGTFIQSKKCANLPTKPMSEETTPRPETTPVEKEIAADKTARQAIDLIIQQLRSMVPTEERNVAIVKLQEGIMWLGMDLKRIGSQRPDLAPNPYPHSYDPNSPVISPTADNLKL